MDYTRQPIVETVITPKDGYRIAIRNSKNPGQEEFIVEALEVVSFGVTTFFRCLERPKAFMVPASDYEILEVRESRLALKAASPEGVVKIPASRESQRTPQRDIERRKAAPQPKEPVVAPVTGVEKPVAESEPVEETPHPVVAAEGRHERRGDRRRGARRRRGRDEGGTEEGRPSVRKEQEAEMSAPAVLEPTSPLADVSIPSEVQATTPPPLSTILPPPSTLIRDDIERLRRNERYRGAFYLREGERESDEVAEEAPTVPLHLQEEQPGALTQEENTYKATPAPLEE